MKPERGSLFRVDLSQFWCPRLPHRLSRRTPQPTRDKYETGRFPFSAEVFEFARRVAQRRFGRAPTARELGELVGFDAPATTRWSWSAFI